MRRSNMLTKLKYFSICLAFVFCATNGSAQQEMPPEDQVEIRLNDGNIIVNKNDTPMKLDYDDMENTYSPYSDLDKWYVSDNPDKVGQALKVFEDKGEPPYQERYWIINQDDQNQKIIIEYTSFDTQPNMIFSPDEDFVYYKNLTDLGETSIIGINLSTREEFMVGRSDEFDLVTCPDDDAAFIALMDQKKKKKIYTIYNLQGEQVNSINQNIRFHNLQDYICY